MAFDELTWSQIQDVQGQANEAECLFMQRSYLEPPPWSPVLQHEKERAGILFSHMSERNHS